MVSVKSPPWLFFLLIYLLSAPFWFVAVRLTHSDLPDSLPVTDVGAVLAPSVSAAVLCYRDGGWPGVRALLARAFDFRRLKTLRWLVVAVFLPIGLCLATYATMRTIGFPVPTLWSVPISFPVVFVFFFIGAAAEEIGYTAYATDTLQRTMSPLAVALVIGFIWALWHLPSMVQVGQEPQLILWGLSGTVALRVLWTWIYNHADRCAFIVILTHAIFNTARTFYPGGRHAYELGSGSVAYSIVIVSAVFVVMVWGTKIRVNARRTDA